MSVPLKLRKLFLYAFLVLWRVTFILRGDNAIVR